MEGNVGDAGHGAGDDGGGGGAGIAQLVAELAGLTVGEPRQPGGEVYLAARDGLVGQLRKRLEDLELMGMTQEER